MQKLKQLAWCWGIGLSALLFARVAWAEQIEATPMPQQGQEQAAPQGPLSCAILPSTDTSDLGLGATLQNDLGALTQATNYFQIQMASYVLPAFTDVEVARAINLLNTRVIMFAYLEKERLSLFLFDSTHPKEFIVTSQVLVDPMLGNVVNQQVVEYKLQVAFTQLTTAWSQAQFQPLPGTQSGDPNFTGLAPDDPKRRAEEGRRLFRELATLEDGKYYLGADVGMARFAGVGPSGSSINFGGFWGFRASDRVRAELGLDLFNYALVHVDGKYLFPLAEKYVSVYASLSVGAIMGTIIQPRDSLSPSLSSGLVFGPGISFDVPLLGANVRGELKLYFGAGTILVGTYGLSYSL
jgi:hypothetical protein